MRLAWLGGRGGQLSCGWLGLGAEAVSSRVRAGDGAGRAVVGRWAGVFRARVGTDGAMAEYAGRPVITLGSLTQLPVAMAEVVR